MVFISAHSYYAVFMMESGSNWQHMHMLFLQVPYLIHSHIFYSVKSKEAFSSAYCSVKSISQGKLLV